MFVNLARLSPHGLVGRLIRYPLRLLPDGAVVRVLRGPARGAKWIVGSATHGCWLGTYEIDKQLELARSLRPGEVFYDIGANVGFYTVLASRLVGPRGFIYAFEPLPTNVGYLTRHVELNRLSNVRLFSVALSDKKGHATFDPGPHRSMGKLAADGSLTVETETVDALVASEKLRPPSCMKIDVEGAEVDVLRGALKTLESAKPMVLVATHSPEIHRCVIDMLREHGYRTTALDPRVDLHQTDELKGTPA